mgnify:CR=1 FL=1
MVVIVAIEKAQVDHALNAQFDDGFAIFGNRLLAAVKLVVDTIKVSIKFLYENQLEIKISCDSLKTRSDILSAQTALQ